MLSTVSGTMRMSRKARPHLDLNALSIYWHREKSSPRRTGKSLLSQDNHAYNPQSFTVALQSAGCVTGTVLSMEERKARRHPLCPRDDQSPGALETLWNEREHLTRNQRSDFEKVLKE